MFFKVEVVYIVFVFYVRRASVVAERYIAAPLDKGYQRFQIFFNGQRAFNKLHFVHAAHNAKVLAVFVKEISWMGAGIYFIGEKAVNPAF